MEIDDLFNKIVSGKGDGPAGGGKDSKKSSSKNSQVSKKSRK